VLTADTGPVTGSVRSASGEASAGAIADTGGKTGSVAITSAISGS
jgi:hypothetical protein